MMFGVVNDSCEQLSRLQSVVSIHYRLAALSYKYAQSIEWQYCVS